VLIVGAGASFGARVGLDATPPPPLGDGLAAYLLEWMEMNHPDRVDPITRNRMIIEQDTDVPDPHVWHDERSVEVVQLLERIKAHPPAAGPAFEPMVDELVRRGSLLVLALLNAVIARSMLVATSSFAEKPDRYDALLQLVRPYIAAVASPNYDILLEESFKRAGIRYWYPGLEEDPGAGAIPFSKIHGSVNVSQGGPSSSGSDYAIVQAQARRDPTRLEPQHALGLSVERSTVIVHHDRAEAIRHYKHWPYDPILASYARTKPATDGRARLDAIRESLRTQLDADPDRDVLIIGMRPPIDDEDDPTWIALCGQLTAYRGRRIYLSPSPAECRAMRRRGFEAIRATLEELVSVGAWPPSRLRLRLLRLRRRMAREQQRVGARRGEP
jgi:hypothetical protein